ncbi:MAG: PTS sugar transporter subunit IIC [Brevinema sp.]
MGQKSFMDKAMEAAAKIAGQRHVMAIRDGFIAFMPFLIIGSLFIIIQDFPLPGYYEWTKAVFGDGFYQFIILPKRFTYDIMSLFVVMFIANRLAQSLKVDGFYSSIISLMSFMMITPMTTSVSDVAGNVIEVGRVITIGGWYGSNGLFVAILTALAITELYAFFINKKIVITMPAGVPPAVARAFSALIPGFLILSLMLAVRGLFLMTPFGNIHEMIFRFVSAPLSLMVANNLLGAIGTVIAIDVLWLFGLNGGTIVNGIMRPLWIPLQDANLQSIQNGQLPTNIITEQFFDMIWIGGAGATFAVAVILALRARSSQYKDIGRLSVLPGLFNINEPIMFGIPIVLNPFTFIPLILGPVAICILNYFLMASGLVAKPTGVIVPWPTPPILQGFLVTGHFSGALMQLLDMIVVGLIWMPFINVLDKRKVEEENSMSNKE